MDLKEQYFGTEIEMTGITREEAANAVGEVQNSAPAPQNQAAGQASGTILLIWDYINMDGNNVHRLTRSVLQQEIITFSIM